MRRGTVVALVLALAPWPRSAAQEAVPPERLAAREWYRDARFGMFTHWGAYSLLGNGEWVMQNRGIRIAEYEWLASTFNPARFDAEEWVTTAKKAGMRYITITARYHDGFSMFGSRVTRYNIVDWTPFRRDPLKELAEAGHGQDDSERDEATLGDAPPARCAHQPRLMRSQMTPPQFAPTSRVEPSESARG